ncbi:unnamed protein product [Caenorhabditis angaria]|uniref:Palmitoyltransferase n=1 Tax=Caenorhabditis angaria TaxID=860376 RepID=A0A9P1NAT6_9PELO|nr:unnamed protein product [Caenorhabditis angaria]
MCRNSIDNCCDWIDTKIDDGTFLPVVNGAHSCMRQIGRLLVYFVYAISFFLAATSFFIILPYEQLYKSPYLLVVLSIFGFYFLINIQFHYYKARTTKPVANPGQEGDSFCEKCNYWKSQRTHHCSVCETCILGMDHHCIWINQCVGSHNHRHFFLFIANLTFAAGTIILAGYPSVYDHIFMETSEHTFCTSILHYAPLQNYICDYNELARTSIVFCYLLSAVLFLMVGGLTLWNVYLISIGFTYIDYLRHSDLKRKPGYRNRLNKGFWMNWKNFLGLRRNRSFFNYVILPRTLPPLMYDNFAKNDAFDLIV